MMANMHHCAELVHSSEQSMPALHGLLLSCTAEVVVCMEVFSGWIGPSTCIFAADL